MKSIFYACILLFLCGHTVSPQGFYKLDWNDEFNGTALDLSKWECQLGTGSSEGLTDWGNNELEYYTQENAQVKDGMLVITARRESKGGKPYTSSRLLTRGKYATKYGRIEARISVEAINGFWPAFWTLPQDSPYGIWASSGEMDIFEAKGRLPQQYSGAIHFGGEWPENTYYTTGDYAFSPAATIEDFHVYAVEWKEREIAWYCDGVLVNKTTEWNSKGNPYPAPFDTEFYILLNLAVGGNFDNQAVPSASFTSGEMKVDYVRVYKWDELLTEPEVPEHTIAEAEQEVITVSQTGDAIQIQPSLSVKVARLYTFDGRLAAEVVHGGTIRTAHLNKGNYVLQVQDTKGASHSFKLILQ
jgi:beta-glucanase (GH16 family)